MEIYIESEYTLLVARIVLGLVFMYFGFPKLMSLKKTAKGFSKKGFKPGWFWGTIVALLESVGALLLVAGVYPTIIAMLLGFHMLVGMAWKYKLGKAFADYSYDLLLATLSLVTVVAGAGNYVFMDIGPGILRLSHILVAIVVAAVLAYLPEILGKKYRKWKA